MTLPAQILAGLPGGYEWLIVLFIILLLFGKRLPGVARSLGQGISNFKRGLSDPDGDDDKQLPDKAEPKSKKREPVEESSDS
jgi:sec-independent protein translocase protein TatA